jgi:D-alanine-D-alanine ligase
MDSKVQFPSGGVIGVLTGGVSKERTQSLKSGDAVMLSLERQGYNARRIDTAEASFIDEIRGVDLAFLAIAGQVAEDGKLQGLLQTLRIPHTGSGVLASALGMRKTAGKTMLRAIGLSVLDDVCFDMRDDPRAAAAKIKAKLGVPVIVKPLSEGSSIGIEIGRTESEIAEIVKRLQVGGMEGFAEPFITGRHITVGALETESGTIGLPPLEIITTQEFFDIPAKGQANMRSFKCPGEFLDHQLSRFSDDARTAHVALGCSGYSRSDFVIARDGTPYWLEINTLPSLMTTATLATMASAVGISYDAMISLIIKSALKNKGYQP